MFINILNHALTNNWQTFDKKQKTYSLYYILFYRDFENRCFF